MVRQKILKFGAVTYGVLAFAMLAGCASGPPNNITITRAAYGFLAGRKDVITVVGPMCNGKAKCSFPVVNQTFAAVGALDPSPGENKAGTFAWKCDDGTEHSYEFAEDKPAVMTCPSDVKKSGCRPDMPYCQSAPGV